VQKGTGKLSHTKNVWELRSHPYYNSCHVTSTICRHNWLGF